MKHSKKKPLFFLCGDIHNKKMAFYGVYCIEDESETEASKETMSRLI